MVALKYSIMINGVTQLIMMKSDVMNDFETIKRGHGLRDRDGRPPTVPLHDYRRSETRLYRVRGVEVRPARVPPLRGLPEAFHRYVEFIERETGVPVRIISVGPDRGETIV